MTPAPRPDASALFSLQRLDTYLGRVRRGAQERSEPDPSALARIEQEREALAGKVPQPFLSWYERARERSSRPPWVVRFAEGRCPACRAMIESRWVASAQTRGAPIACPRCSRVLVPVKGEGTSAEEGG